MKREDILNVSEEVAKSWIKKAKYTPTADNCFNAALCFSFGKGAEKDIDKAIFLFEKAAQKGDVHAMNNAGGLYFEKGDYDTAAEWLQRAALNGDKVTEKNLVKCVFLRGLYF